MSTNRFTPEQHAELTRIADFSHVFIVLPGGKVADPRDGHTLTVEKYRRYADLHLRAPEALDVDPSATTLDGWDLPLSGMTGQYGYSGPWLHDSERIAGTVAERVLSTPGYWVAIYGSHSCEGECGLPEGEDHDSCETTLEGWTFAYRVAS